MSRPKFVVVGHVVNDEVPGGVRLGGTAAFAALQARALGVAAGIVTRTGREAEMGELRGIEIAGRSSEATTVFENVYDGPRRMQHVRVQAEGIEADDCPPAWREAPMVLLGPVCGELPPGAAAWFRSELVGVSAQGWLRELDGARRVRRAPWKGDPFWRGCDVLFVSREDLAGDESQLARWAEEVDVIALTSDRRGARMHAGGAWKEIEAFPAEEVDPTGAGDVFAAAFMVGYHETKDIGSASRLASAAAACSVEAPGAEGVADRSTIEARMAAHPEIALR